MVMQVVIPRYIINLNVGQFQTDQKTGKYLPRYAGDGAFQEIAMREF